MSVLYYKSTVSTIILLLAKLDAWFMLIHQAKLGEPGMDV